MKINAGIVGGAGYTGGELVRILLNHPECQVQFVLSQSNAGKYVFEIHTDLEGDTALKFTSPSDDAVNFDDVDVLFLCVGHDEAIRFMENNIIDGKVKIIDLSQDFRLIEWSSFNERKFIYGLPELNKKQILTAANIANPGCFATALQLGLLPLAKAGVLKELYSTGITGSTGAGQSLSPTSHFSWRSNNIQAYKSLKHQHLHEVYQSLHQLQKNIPADSFEDGILSFVPWRGDFTRGIFVTSQLACDIEIHELEKLYDDYYADHPFTFLSKKPIALKQVLNTNKCMIQLEKAGKKLVIHSAIDNLLKGASGQAIQNMNLMFGIEETSGLKLKGSFF
ncbi:MAG: N-acetyl-gamma-glutamyl-phosphate reductase [Ginsengibacter sp.]